MLVIDADMIMREPFTPEASRAGSLPFLGLVDLHHGSGPGDGHCCCGCCCSGKRFIKMLVVGAGGCMRVNR